MCVSCVAKCSPSQSTGALRTSKALLTSAWALLECIHDFYVMIREAELVIICMGPLILD